MTLEARILGLLVVLYFAAPARAQHDQTYGLDGTTSGRVGGVTAEPNNPFAALLNPALLAASPAKHFSFNISWVNTQIKNPSNVLLDSRRYRTRDGADRIGNAELTQTRTSLWAAGYNHPFSLGIWPNHRAGVGLALSGPMGQARRWVALSPYDFTPLRYGAADTQFKATFSGALELIPRHLFLGGGLSLYMTSSGVGESALTTENPSSRMVMDVGFNSAGLVGLYGSLDSWSSAVVYRAAVNPVFYQKFVGIADVGGMDVANQPAEVQGSLYFEPAILECDVQKNWTVASASVGISWQRWSAYQPRYMMLSTRDASGNNRSTVPANVPMRDTWNPRASVEWRGWRRWKIGAGYQFRPTAIADLSGIGNLLDADTHVAGLSLKRELGNPLFFNGLSLTLHAQAHFLKARTVVKAAADSIGAPGYTIAGQAWIVGATLASQL